MVEDPLVEALEPCREHREGRLESELLHELLVELTPLGRERDHAVRRYPSVHGVERGCDDVDAQHHPRPAPVGVVVHLPRRQRGRVAIVEDTELEPGVQYCGQRTALACPVERTGNEREDVEEHDAEP